MFRVLQRLLLTCTFALSGTVAFAQAADDAGTDGGSLLDGGLLVDGGAGIEGGSDRDNPEADDHTGRVVTVCHFSSDCTRGFQCVAGRCTWARYRDAEGGFCGVVSGALLLGGVFALTRKRKVPKP